MKKDYKIWMPLKSEINNNERRPIGFKEREIWYACIGENIGFEEDGKGKKFARPVLILKVFNRKLCFIIPLSTSEKHGDFYYLFDGNTGKKSLALLSQSKPLDSSRLKHKIGVAKKEDFKEIKQRLKKVLSL